MRTSLDDEDDEAVIGTLGSVPTCVTFVELYMAGVQMALKRGMSFRFPFFAVQRQVSNFGTPPSLPRLEAVAESLRQAELGELRNRFHAFLQEHGRVSDLWLSGRDWAGDLFVWPAKGAQSFQRSKGNLVGQRDYGLRVSGRCFTSVPKLVARILHVSLGPTGASYCWPVNSSQKVTTRSSIVMGTHESEALACSALLETPSINPRGFDLGLNYLKGNYQKDTTIVWDPLI